MKILQNQTILTFISKHVIIQAKYSVHLEGCHMTRMTKIRVTEINHTKGTLSAIGKFDGTERPADFQFSQTYRVVEINNIQGDNINFSLSNSFFAAETYPRIGDEIYVFDAKGLVLGWCYLLDYELALFKYKRKKPVRITGWMKTLGILPSDKLTKQLVTDRFRELSRACHPDKPDGAAAKFRKLVDARDEALRSISR